MFYSRHTFLHDLIWSHVPLFSEMKDGSVRITIAMETRPPEKLVLIQKKPIPLFSDVFHCSILVMIKYSFLFQYINYRFLLSDENHDVLYGMVPKVSQ